MTRSFLCIEYGFRIYFYLVVNWNFCNKWPFSIRSMLFLHFSFVFFTLFLFFKIKEKIAGYYNPLIIIRLHAGPIDYDRVYLPSITLHHLEWIWRNTSAFTYVAWYIIRVEWGVCRQSRSLFESNFAVYSRTAQNERERKQNVA